jgi:hypothetical protein
VEPFHEKGTPRLETRLLEAEEMQVPCLLQMVEKLPEFTDVSPLVDVPAQDSETGRETWELLSPFVKVVNLSGSLEHPTVSFRKIDVIIVVK